jgi:hypothetical protein
VLAGASHTLRSGTIRSVLIEVDARKWTAVSDLLEGAGFMLDKRLDREKAGAPTYGLFVRRVATAAARRSIWWTFLRSSSQQ